MAQYIVETPDQATSHGAQWSAVSKLVQRTLEQSQREVLDVETETFSSGFATRATVGIMLKDRFIDNMVVGGPAHMCKDLASGDEIIKIDGTDTPNKEAIIPLLRGSDLPGSTVDITVKKKNGGSVTTVKLVRMPTEAIADRRKLFEKFTDIKTEAMVLSDRKLAVMTDEVIDLWSKMVLADMVHDQQIEDNVKDLQAQLNGLLQEVVEELPKLQVSFEENKELVALRAQYKQQEEELAKCQSLCASHEDLIKQLKAQLEASRKELSDTKDADAKIIDDKDREIAELKKQLRDLKSAGDHKVADLEAQIEELKKKLAAANERGDKEEAEKNRLKGENDILNASVKSKDDEIDALKKELAALGKAFNDTKAALDLDESELKKDRELLLKDKEQLAAKDAEIEDLKKKLAALEKELKDSKEKAIEDLKAKDGIIQERDAEIEELKKRLATLEKELRDMKNASSKDGNTIAGLQDEIKRLKARIEEQDTRIKEDSDTIRRCQEEQSDLIAALKREQQSVANLQADCVSKDKEIEELRRQLEEARKKLRDLEESSAASARDNSALQKQIEELTKKVGKLENDIQRGREQLEAKDAEIDTLKAELKKQLEAKDAEIDALKKKVAELEAELKKLQEQLATLKEEREKLAKEAALLAATRAELESKKAETEAAKAALKDANDEIERLNKLLEELEAAKKDNAVDFDLERAIQLTTFAKELVAKEHWCDHTNPGTQSNALAITTIGIAFDDKSCVISNVLVGGPAFNSKQVFKGDKIVSIDGDPVRGGDIIPKLKGSDVPGSVVIMELSRKDKDGKIILVEVKLRRMANSQIADKRQIFELFTKLIDKSKKNRDTDSETFTKDALDLWTAEMLEQHEHDQLCIDNLHKMQDQTDNWLVELLQMLQGSEQGAIKRASAPPPAPLISIEDLQKLRTENKNLKNHLNVLTEDFETLKKETEELKKQLALSKEDSEKLRKENEELKKQLGGVQQDLEKLRPKLSQLQQELQGANAALDACAAAAEQKDAEIEDLKNRLAALQRAFDNDESQLKTDRELLAKDQTDLSAKDAEIAELKKKLAALQTQLNGMANLTTEDLRKMQEQVSQLQQELEKAGKALTDCLEAAKLKDAEIEALKKQVAELENLLDSKDTEIAELKKRLEAQTATSDELEKLRAKLALIQSELKVATEALAAATAGMQAKDATIEDLQKRLAALQKELQDARDEMDDTVAKQGQLSKCRELIALSQRRIAEDHLAEHAILTQVDQDATTVGLMFDEKGGKIHVDYVMVGGPAFKSKKLAKDDIIRSIDGKKVKGDGVIKALQGPASTTVTLEVESAKTGQVEEVVLERMLTALIADKRKMFDLFTKIEGRFNRHKDSTGVSHTEDALEMWTNMCLEEQEQDDKCLANVTAMQRDTRAWLTECDHILAGITGEAISEKPAPSVPGVNGALNSPRTGTPSSALAALSGSNTQVATLNQAMKKMEQELKKEQDKRKNLESELTFLKALDKKLAKASEGFNENSKKEAPAPEAKKQTNGLSGLFSFFTGPQKEPERAQSPPPRYTVVKQLEGPVQWDDDFLLDLLEMPETDSAADARVASLTSSLGGTPSLSPQPSPRSSSPSNRPAVGYAAGSI